jgi:hypothetical protein
MTTKNTTQPTPEQIAARLEYLRGEINAERISYGQIAELQGLAEYIDPDDVQLLEWAGVPEQPEARDVYATARDFNKRNEWDINAAEALAVEVLTDANAHAEVRLYKAAPELLAALRSLLVIVDRINLDTYAHAGPVGPGQSRDWKEQVDARAAIARATGDSQAEGGKL